MAGGEQELLQAVGEIRGLLAGMQQMMQAQHESTQQRINDLHGSVTQRLNEHRDEIRSADDKADRALNEVAQLKESIVGLRKDVNKRSATAGAGTGALVSAGIELIKALASS